MLHHHVYASSVGLLVVGLVILPRGLQNMTVQHHLLLSNTFTAVVQTIHDSWTLGPHEISRV